MFVLVRTVTYSALFIGLLLIYYRFVRNPMYIGAGLALAGAALFYGSLPLLGYTAVFFLATHLFVLWYEEPTLRRSFGPEYDAYSRQVKRWWPRV